VANVFVTGAAGFVGPFLARHLRTLGDTVWGGSLEGAPHPDYTAIELDVTDPARVREVMRSLAPAEVYHLAAISRPALQNGEGYLEVNLGGTLNVLAAAAEIGARVLVVSSGYVYGRHAEPITEATAIAPIHAYGASKAAAEMAALTWALTGQHVVRVRPFNHVGPGQSTDFFVPTLIGQLGAVRAGRAEPRVVLGSLDAVRDIADVRDVVRAYPGALRAAAAGSVYNVCTGTGVSMRDVVELAVELAGVEVEVITDPERVRPNDLPRLVGRADSLTALTGWHPERTLAATLTDMLASAEA
jgi:GDP-4-dehydro-6-deoxy-D-mannose reductase